MRNRCIDGGLKENQEPFQIFLAEIGKKSVYPCYRINEQRSSWRVQVVTVFDSSLICAAG